VKEVAFVTLKVVTGYSKGLNIQNSTLYFPISV